jgi:NAD(P)-dependent dehydrogenase (short-subunit alcohol dehydrogenase family)
MAKYGMSMCALGMAEEFRDEGVAVNTLWPRTGNSISSIRSQVPHRGFFVVIIVSYFNSQLISKLFSSLTDPQGTYSTNKGVTQVQKL